MEINKKGMMFVLSSPSGVGKTTLTKKLAENNSQFVISISHTTRKPRPNEINGKDYHFVSTEEFNELVKKMVDSDLDLANREKVLIDNNLMTPTWEYAT